MEKAQELIEAPLSSEELGARYRELCEDPLYSNVPGKIEIDVWGRLLMSPTSSYHGALRARLCQRIGVLGRYVFLGASVLTTAGVLVADVAWASAQFMALHNYETPYTSAPELCIEVVSHSKSVKELDEKRAAYLAAGAREVWIVYAQSKRFAFYGNHGLVPHSAYAVDLTDCFI